MTEITYKEFTDINKNDAKKDLFDLYKSFTQYYIDKGFNLLLVPKSVEEIDFKNYVETDLVKDHVYLIIAYHEGKSVGFILSYVEDISIRFKINKKADIDMLFIEETFRSKGIATTLIEKTIRYYKEIFNITVISLDTQKANIEAVNFYEKLGFVCSSISMNKKI